MSCTIAHERMNVCIAVERKQLKWIKIVYYQFYTVWLYITCYLPLNPRSISKFFTTLHENGFGKGQYPFLITPKLFSEHPQICVQSSRLYLSFMNITFTIFWEIIINDFLFSSAYEIRVHFLHVGLNYLSKIFKSHNRISL